jgi:2-oxoglutarate dehydrogenase E1 component
MSKSLQERYRSTPLFGGNAPFVEGYYEQYLDDPGSVPPDLAAWFRDFGGEPGAETPRGPVEAEFAARARRGRAAAHAGPVPPELLQKQAAVLQLIQAYRMRGHQLANLDPLGLAIRQRPREVEPRFHGLDSDDGTRFSTANLGGDEQMTLTEIIDYLERIYAGPVAAQLSHITDASERLWLQRRFEQLAETVHVSDEDKRFLLDRLTAAEGIERYLHTRYVGQKRFSLEGGDSMIPLLDDLIQNGGASGMEEVVIGMAHRGRINVLVNVLGKSPEELFSEFEGTKDPEGLSGSGDVKYHLGFSSDHDTPGGKIHVALAFNPSHLEIVNPVVEGSVRARQDRRGDVHGASVLPILVHGDAAFAGQGVVMETLQMSQARGFATGGTVHVICNNQIGFTISDPRDARSTPHCSDVAKMVEAPIFHVNADHPEAVLVIGRLALEYRQRFGKDVVIDLVCYRRHGHNEADEPAATQPDMYKVVRKHPTARRLYAEKLAAEGVVGEEESKELVEAYRQGLDEGHVAQKKILGMIGNKFTIDWTRFRNVDWSEEVASALDQERAAALATRITTVPDEVSLHPRVARIMADRLRMAEGDLPMDWGFAETMAYASLLTEGHAIRLTGQDSGRGTFFHRHAVLHDQKGADDYVPLEHLADDQAPFRVTDSLLSEEAVLGFEYGYSTTAPDTLVIWEGQFGDFVNGAQVVIDQFISSGESKWERYCGLTLFLPHGYEGQGPEHSSARLERFLQLCAENNMAVCVPSTPAQMFHMLRQQMLRNFRKPLIVMTPKSLLRHKRSVSDFSALTEGHFHWLIPEQDDLDDEAVRRIVFCSGKVYYDLIEAREKHAQEDVAIVRLEQLYPFPVRDYAATIRRYPKARQIVWCQEEPQNQGAWYQIRHRLQEPLSAEHDLLYAGRPGAAAPASGHYQLHVKQQQVLVEAALGGGPAAGRRAEEKNTVRNKA